MILTVLAYALAISVVLALVYAAKSVRLQNRFRQLGTVEGRHVDEVIRLVGPPGHRTAMGAGREILEWRRVGFHIALRFEEGICQGSMRVDT